MLRWISSVPPRIESRRRGEEQRLPLAGGVEPVGAEDARARASAVAWNTALPRSFDARALRAGRPARAVSRARAASSHHHARLDRDGARSARSRGSRVDATRAGERRRAARRSSQAAGSTAPTAPRSYDEARERDAPAFADRADPIGVGHATSSRNTSVKCASPFICRSGRTSTPAACHVERERGDALVLRHRRSRCGRAGSPIASSAPGSSTPSGR